MKKDELTSPADELMAMADDRFEAYVDQDLRRKKGSDHLTPHDVLLCDALRDPKVVDRWHACLRRISRSIEGQLAQKDVEFQARKARLERASAEAAQRYRRTDVPDQHRVQDELDRLDLEILSDREAHFDQRSKMLRFKTGLDETISKARGLVDAQRGSQYESLVAEERNHYATRVRELETAIRDHKAHFPADEEPSKSDRNLWSQVEDDG